MAKYIRNSAGQLIEEASLPVSAGAGDSGKIPELDVNGKLDYSLVPRQILYNRFTQDVSSSSTTTISVSAGGGSISPIDAGTYFFDFRILFSTAAPTTGIVLAAYCSSTPTVAVSGYQIAIPTSTTAITYANINANNTTGGSSSSSAGANVKMLATLKGIVTVPGSGSSMHMYFASKVSGSTVTLYIGSIMRMIPL